MRFNIIAFSLGMHLREGVLMENVGSDNVSEAFEILRRFKNNSSRGFIIDYGNPGAPRIIGELKAGAIKSLINF